MSITFNLKKTGDANAYPQEVKKNKSEKIGNIVKVIQDQPLADISSAEALLKKCRDFKKEDLYDASNLTDFVQGIYLFPCTPELLKDNPIYSVTYNMGQSKILELNECACIDGSRIPCETSKGLGLRSQFEHELLQKIEKHHADKKLGDAPLCLMSFGCGGCLSDWMIAVQLILLGFTNLELHLIECDLGRKTRINNLKEFLEHFPETKVSITSYCTLEEFGEKNIICDVAYALDLERKTHGDAFVKLLLSPNGFTFASKYAPHWDVLRDCPQTKA